MLVRHATARKNLDSIRKRGLLAKKAKGVLKAVWVHTLSKSEWAVIHVCNRHGLRAEDVVILELSVPPDWLTRSNRKGLWRTQLFANIPPERIVGVLEISDLGK